MRWLWLLGLCGCDILFQLNPVPLHDASPDTPTVDPGLVAYYPMDTVGAQLAGCMPDALGGEAGNCVGGTPVLATGVRGRAYTFDGTNRVQLADTAAFDTASFTVAIWYQLASAPNGNYKCPINRIYGTEADDAWQVCLFDAQIYTKFGLAAVYAPVIPDVGAWHHLALTYDASSTSWTYWLDGLGLTSGTGTPILDKTQPIVLGTDLDVGTVGSPFDGLLDDLRFYDRALTANEIMALVLQR
ncbi:MAG: LamG domain-containing protein [Deltaproteobacteria bacterium]|nr:LamG domain-containing protein [Deltaproteobacteria bacterium]